MPGGRFSLSRETRLLLLTIALSVGVLLLLARFRFPDETPAPPAQPLERLAARATFDELAGIVERLDRTIAPSMTVLRVASPQADDAQSLSTLLAGDAGRRPAIAYVPAIRVRPTAALALLDARETVQGIVGDDQAVPLVIARDPLRRLALVRVPAPPADNAWQWRRLDPITVPRYVVSVEASRGGSTLRPVFFGRADRFADARWSEPLLALGHASVAVEGSFVFSLDGQLIGLAVEEAGVMALVPADEIQAVADRLHDQGTPHVADFGITLRPLSAGDVKGLNVTSGLIVSAVAAGSLAEGRVRAGDLLQAVDGEPAVNAETLLLRLAATPPGTTRTFLIRRGTESIEVPLTTAAPAANGPTS